MYHFIYRTTNLLNGKFYIGKHSTQNLNDGYMGSGSALLAAMNKHGKECFKTTIIEFFEHEEDVVRREKEIATQEFCKRDDVYNINAANQVFTWSGVKRPEQSAVMKLHKPWAYVKPENRIYGKVGRANHMYGRIAPNAKKIRIINTALHIDIVVPSLRIAAEYIEMDRANARKLLQNKSKSRKGWVLQDVTYRQ